MCNMQGVFKKVMFASRIIVQVLASDLHLWPINDRAVITLAEKLHRNKKTSIKWLFGLFTILWHVTS